MDEYLINLEKKSSDLLKKSGILVTDVDSFFTGIAAQVKGASFKTCSYTSALILSRMRNHTKDATYTYNKNDLPYYIDLHEKLSSSEGDNLVQTLKDIFAGELFVAITFFPTQLQERHRRNQAPNLNSYRSNFKSIVYELGYDELADRVEEFEFVYQKAFSN